MTDLPLPPPELRFMGEDDKKFVSIGNGLVRSLVSRAGLEPSSKVLDLGSGYGRLTHALLRTGWWDGDYVGIDLSQKHINWCNQNLGSDRVRFLFRDLANDRYNPKGTVQPVDLTIPVEDVDVMALFSVFTHMWPTDIEAYLRLASSVLAPDGTMYATFFVFDWRWRLSDLLGRSERPLPNRHSSWCRYMTADDPLHVIAYKQEWITSACREAGLQVVDVHRRGKSHQSQTAVVIKRA